MPKRTCIFCLQPGRIEAEHIWGQWIERIIRSRPGDFFVIQQLLPNGSSGSGYRPSKQWRDSKIGLTAKLVCRQCNNTWMSDIEKASRSAMKDMILSNDPQTLGEDQCRAIANFLFKTSVILDHMDSSRKPFFSPAIRQKFSVSRAIPKSVQMWFAAFSSERFSGTYSTYYFEPKIYPLNRINYYVVNFLIGHLLLQLIAKRWVKSHGWRDELPNVKHESAADFTTQVWPLPTASVSWPPSVRISREALDSFSTRFSRVLIDHDK